ncbi:MAG: S41 family peptidase [Acidobacteria bacterium]|nr:S41 family peptidase [Acidobacteriota bacterium]
MIYALLFALFLPAPAVAEEEVWRSIGFGNLYRINGMRLSAFEITSTTCVHSFDALRTRRPVPGAERSFRRPDGGILAVSAGGTAGQVSIYSPGALYKVRLERIANMPSNCNPPATNTPQTVFEIFASTFTEHYISFERRRVDWKKSIEEYRARVNRQSTPQQTFDALESMRASLYDLHTGIEAPSLKRESAASFRSGSERLIGASVEYFAKEGRNALFSITDKAYLGSKLRSYCRGQLQYLLLESGAGYLRILSFGGYARRGKDRSALDEAFDEMFANPKLRALVIDLRLSFGGEDQLALAMAARLSRYRYLAFTIEPHVPVGVARPADPVYVEPSSRSVFSGPVILLTSPVTMSAAEVLVLALRGRTPKVHVIGEATQGVFCDPLERHLPNGWTFALPNTVYRSPKGETFDVDGIPPDIAVPAFAKEDVAAGRDAAMSRALKLLTENQ